MLLKFNFNIDLLDIENNEGEFTLSKQLYKSKSMKQEYIEHYFVDLGLPSGTIWCKYNLGCDFDLLSSNPESTSPKDWYGNYYAWGETKPKNEYSWNTYKHAKGDIEELTRYCTKSKDGYEEFTDNLVELLPEDDVAYLTNSNWKIPTKELFDELLEYTNNKWISGKGKDLYMNVKGLAGRLLTSKINGNQLFIPAAGYKGSSSLFVDGSGCYLLSSSLDIYVPNDVWYLFSISSYIRMSDANRCYGLSVRPIINKNN